MSAHPTEHETNTISNVILLVLQCATKAGYSTQVLASLTQKTKEELEPLLEEMSRGKKILKTEDNTFITAKKNNFKYYQDILIYSRIKNPFFNLLSSYFQGNYNEFFDLAWKFFYNSLCNENLSFDKSKAIYELFCELSLKLPVRTFDTEIAKNFFCFSYRAISISHMFPWNHRKTLIWLFKAKGLAIYYNYSFYCSIFNLSIGYICATDFTNKTCMSYFEKAKKEILKIEVVNNEKLEFYSMPFKGFIDYLDCNFTRSINCALYFSIDKFDKKKFSAENNYYLRIGYNYAAMSAIINGELDIALSILKNGMSVTRGIKIQRIPHEIFHIFSAFVHMLKGEVEEFKNIIGQYDYQKTKNNLTMSALWLIRMRTYFYYLNGDIEKSYRFYCSEMDSAIKEEFRGYILAPFMLEIFVKYYLDGYPPPFGISIHDEIKFALNSPSKLLHLIAHRAMAEISFSINGWNDEEGQQSIQKSLELTNSISAQLERTKTMILYVRSLINQKKYEHVDALIKEILDTKSKFSQLIIIPKDLNDYISSQVLSKQNTWLVPDIENEKETIEEIVINKDSFIYSCEEMRQIYKRINFIAEKDVSVLILGETGVGKEHIARYVHKISKRSGEFIAVNLSSIPEELFESEFYGYEKGAFTGASHTKKGLFELANHGTIFLDEVGDISHRLQVKLLRVLQEKEFMRVGGQKSITSEFRIISATNKDLQKEVMQNNFREDLFYRLNVISLTIPPLRNRQKDVVFIAKNFLSLFSKRYVLPSRNFSQDDIEFLESYNWPGNIRELKNYVERFVLFSENGLKVLTNSTLSNPIVEKKEKQEHAYPQKNTENIFFRNTIDQIFSLEELQAQYIEYIYILKNGQVGGDKGIAAALQISKVSVYNWIKKLNLYEKYPKKIIGMPTLNR